VDGIETGQLAGKLRGENWRTNLTATRLQPAPDHNFLDMGRLAVTILSVELSWFIRHRVQASAFNVVNKP
jgi:hypothetical protein